MNLVLSTVIVMVGLLTGFRWMLSHRLRVMQLEADRELMATEADKENNRLRLEAEVHRARLAAHTALQRAVHTLTDYKVTGPDDPRVELAGLAIEKWEAPK